METQKWISNIVHGGEKKFRRNACIEIEGIISL